MALSLHRPHMLKASLLAVASGIAIVGCATADEDMNLGAKEASKVSYTLEQVPPAGYDLVWADEFNGEGLPDASKWAYDTHANKGGWYNNELQYYSEARLKNSRQEDGVLIIEAHAEELDEMEDWGGQEFTSARLITDGKQTWTYGFYEISAKLPCAYGSWPAIWTLGTAEDKNWPEIGEIDIMEHVGRDPGTVHGTLHTKDFNHTINTQRANQIYVDDVCEAFHRYQLHWTPEKIAIGMDDEMYFELKNNGEGYGSWPFDDPHYLLLNVAVGGWGGEPDQIDKADFPVRMEVDYVRVWQEAE